MLGIRRYLRFDAPPRRFLAMLSRRLTVAPLMQPALTRSASSAFWPSSYPSPGTRLGSTRMTLLALIPSTAADECTLPMQLPARPVYPRAWKPRSTAVEPAIEPAILSPSVPASQRRPGARLCRTTAHACSDCACLPALPDKLRLCTTVVGPLTSESTASTLLRLRRCCAALLI